MVSSSVPQRNRSLWFYQFDLISNSLKDLLSDVTTRYDSRMAQKVALAVWWPDLNSQAVDIGLKCYCWTSGGFVACLFEIFVAGCCIAFWPECSSFCLLLYRGWYSEWRCLLFGLRVSWMGTFHFGVCFWDMLLPFSNWGLQLVSFGYRCGWLFVEVRASAALRVTQPAVLVPNLPILSLSSALLPHFVAYFFPFVQYIWFHYKSPSPYFSHRFAFLEESCSPHAAMP